MCKQQYAFDFNTRCVCVCLDYEFIAIISDNMLSKLQLICFIQITTANGINRHDIKPIDLFVSVWMSKM